MRGQPWRLKGGQYYTLFNTQSDILHAYHVSALNGEEASILMMKDATTWHFVEVRGYCDLEVSVETVYFVEQWLAEHNRRILQACDLENDASARD